MPNVDPVILQLKADVDRYNADVSKAHKLTDQKLSAIEAKGFQMGQSLKKGFSLAGAAAGAFAASMVVDKVVQAATAGLEYASSLGEVAQQLGVTTNALQEYRYAGSQAGLATAEVDQALGQLTRRIGEAASGTKAQAEAFDKLGISVKDSNGEIIDAGEAIPQIADALQRIESPAERAAILMDLFGRSGQKLEPLLAGGSQAVNNLRNAAHELGIVLSEQQIQNADDTADKLSAVKQVLEANIASAVSNNTNSILALANALAQVVVWAGKAAEAYTRFKLNQGIAQESAKSESIFSRFARPEALAESRRKIDAYRAELRRLDGTQGTIGGGVPTLQQLTGGRANRAGGGVATPATGAGGAGGGAPRVSAGGGGGGGRSAAEIAHQFDNQLASYAQQALSAMQGVAKSADERAELELRSVEIARVRTLADINTSAEFSAAQKDRLRAQVETLADLERERVEFQRKAQAERDTADLAEAQYRTEADALRDQLELTDSNAKRRDLAFEILDLEYRHQRAKLESVIASETAADADKRLAQITLDGLNNAQAAKRAGVARDNQSPGQQYVSDLRKEAENINDAFEEAATNGLDRLNDGLADTLKSALGLHGILGDIVGDFIEIALRQSLLKPLAESLFGGGGGGGIGGLFGSLLGGGKQALKLAGRASGGYIAPGQMVRVNESGAPGKVEAFMSRDGGSIIPLGQMNAMASAGGGNGMATVRLELSGDIDARIQQVSGPVAVQIVRAAAPTIIDASARETMARAGRPRI